MKLIGNTKLNIEALLNRLFLCLIIYVVMKVLLGIGMIYISSEQMMNGVYPSEETYMVMSIFTDINNVTKLVLTPLLLLYGMKQLCEVLYLQYKALKKVSESNKF